MPIGARLIFPCIAPVRASTNDGERRVRDGRFTTRSCKQGAAVIPCAQLAQAKLCRTEMIDAGLLAAQLAANQIQLNFVERPSAGRSPKINFTAGIFPSSRNARGK